MKTFMDYAYYYDMLNGEKDYQSEAKQIDSFIKKYGKAKENINILDLGCGTGRHDFELCKLGYKLTGIDISENMINIAQAAKENMHLS